MNNAASTRDRTHLHPVEELFERMSQIQNYPFGVVPMTGRIRGTAFFPGGSGLWGTTPDRPLPPMPCGKVMIVGHNFDSEKSYKQSLADGAEATNVGTWGALRKLLTEAEIIAQRLFFHKRVRRLHSGRSRKSVLSLAEGSILQGCLSRISCRPNCTPAPWRHFMPGRLCSAISG